MVAEARRPAVAAGITFSVVGGRAEDLPVDFGSFDLVTIGRALHWMDRAGTLAAFDRILAPAGRILVCGSKTVPGGANPWFTTFESVVRSWGEDRDGSHRHIYDHWFDGTEFAKITEIKIRHQRDITPEALFEQALTRSSSSRAILGARIGACPAEPLATLTPFFPSGSGPEIVEAKAVVFAEA